MTMDAMTKLDRDLARANQALGDWVQLMNDWADMILAAEPGSFGHVPVPVDVDTDEDLSAVVFEFPVPRDFVEQEIEGESMQALLRNPKLAARGRRWRRAHAEQRPSRALVNKHVVRARRTNGGRR